MKFNLKSSISDSIFASTSEQEWTLSLSCSLFSLSLSLSRALSLALSLSPSLSLYLYTIYPEGYREQEGTSTRPRVVGYGVGGEESQYHPQFWIAALKYPPYTPYRVTSL